VKWLLAAVIEVYWLIAPARLRARCLFGESCSHFVMHAVKTGGARSGLNAFAERWRQCRPGYYRLYLPDSGLAAIALADGSIVLPECLSDRVRQELGFECPGLVGWDGALHLVS